MVRKREGKVPGKGREECKWNEEVEEANGIRKQNELEKKNTTLSKNYTLNKNGFEFSLDLKTEAKGKFNYVIEHNFHFADYEKVLVNGLLLEENGILKNTHILEIEDLFLKKTIIIQMQIPCDIYYFQLKTLSQSEHGFDLSTQGVSFAMKTSFEDSLNIVGSLEVFDV